MRLKVCHKERRGLRIFFREVAIQHSFTVFQMHKVFLLFGCDEVINTLSRSVFRIGGSNNSIDC